MAIELANYFLTPVDEATLSIDLKTEFPGLRFIGGQIWPDENPPVRDGIQECVSGISYFWWTEIISHFPAHREPTGHYRGASAGVTLQFMRCKMRDDNLTMGQMRLEMSSFPETLAPAIKFIFNLMRRKFRAHTECVSFKDDTVVGESKSYLVGPDAALRSASGLKLAIHSLTYLKLKNTAEQDAAANP